MLPEADAEAPAIPVWRAEQELARGGRLDTDHDKGSHFVIEFCEAKATRCGFEGSEFSHPRGLRHLQKTPGA